MLSISDFLRVSRDAVRLFPLVDAQEPCKQLQTFRVLSQARGAEIGSATLGAVPSDKDTPFFWSRAWEEAKYSPNALTFDWPCLTMFEVFNETGGSIFGNGFTRSYTLEVSVLDVYRDDCVQGLDTGCKARPVNQIFLDTEELLDSFFQYLSNVVIATTSADATPKVYYEPWLEAQVTALAISSYSLSYSLGNTLAALNRKTQYARVEFPTQKIYGTKAQVSFKAAICPTVEYETETADYGLLSFEAGCKNC